MLVFVNFTLMLPSSPILVLKIIYVKNCNFDYFVIFPPQTWILTSYLAIDAGYSILFLTLCTSKKETRFWMPTELYSKIEFFIYVLSYICSQIFTALSPAFGKEKHAYGGSALIQFIQSAFCECQGIESQGVPEIDLMDLDYIEKLICVESVLDNKIRR